MSEKEYTEEIRERLIQSAEDPMNKMRGMSESTGLLILDGIYSLIKTIREENLRGLE